jgi:hypothetical protein
MKWSKPARKMSLSIIIISLTAIAAGALFYRSLEAVAFAAAAAAMAVLNIIKIFMIERTVQKTSEIEEPSHGKNYARLQYTARLALTGLVLAAAAVYARHTGSYSSVWGAVAGVFTFQIAAYTLKFHNLSDDETGSE